MDRLVSSKFTDDQHPETIHVPFLCIAILLLMFALDWADVEVAHVGIAICYEAPEPYVSSVLGILAFVLIIVIKFIFNRFHDALIVWRFY